MAGHLVRVYLSLAARLAGISFIPTLRTESKAFCKRSLCCILPAHIHNLLRHKSYLDIRRAWYINFKPQVPLFRTGGSVYSIIYYHVIYMIFSPIFYYLSWYYRLLCYITLYYVIVYHFVSCFLVLYYTKLCYIILYYTILYYTILYHIILYYIKLYYIILYYILLYYIISYYIILHHIQLYSIVIYYII